MANAHHRGHWPQIAAQARALWTHHLGNTCAGWQQPAHPATDLTVDHIEPGELHAGLTILCRSCNAQRGTHPWLEPLVTIGHAHGVAVVAPDRRSPAG